MWLGSVRGVPKATLPRKSRTTQVLILSQYLMERKIMLYLDYLPHYSICHYGQVPTAQRAQMGVGLLRGVPNALLQRKSRTTQVLIFQKYFVKSPIFSDVFCFGILPPPSFNIFRQVPTAQWAKVVLGSLWVNPRATLQRKSRTTQVLIFPQ